jgi:hypothetical protein
MNQMKEKKKKKKNLGNFFNLNALWKKDFYDKMMALEGN